MRQALTTLTNKREALINKAARQRDQVAQTIAPLQAPLALVDNGISLIQFAKRHPLLSTGSVAVALKLINLLGLGKSFGRYWARWQLVKKVAAIIWK
ncbi:MAG TPA: YqjK family protein [Methylophilus sp.]